MTFFVPTYTRRLAPNPVSDHPLNDGLAHWFRCIQGYYSDLDGGVNSQFRDLVEGVWTGQYTNASQLQTQVPSPVGDNLGNMRGASSGTYALGRGIQMTGTSSICMWLRPSVLSGNRVVMGGLSNQYFPLVTNSDIFIRGPSSGTALNVPHGGRIALGKWSYVVISQDGTDARCYIDGDDIGLMDGGGLVADPFLSRLFAYETGSSAFAGWLNDIRIFHRPLSRSEALQNQKFSQLFHTPLLRRLPRVLSIPPVPGITPNPAISNWTASTLQRAINTTPASATSNWTASASLRQIQASPASATSQWEANTPARQIVASPASATSNWTASTPIVGSPDVVSPETIVTQMTAGVPTASLGAARIPNPATSQWVASVAQRAINTTPTPATSQWEANTPVAGSTFTPLPASSNWTASTPLRQIQARPTSATSQWVANTPAAGGAIVVTPETAISTWTASILDPGGVLPPPFQSLGYRVPAGLKLEYKVTPDLNQE